MNDETYHYRPGKRWRRKRVHEGATFSDGVRARLEAAQQADKGVLCRECGKRRHWNEIYFKYSAATSPPAGLTVIVRSWFCKRCDNMIKEDEL